MRAREGGWLAGRLQAHVGPRGDAKRRGRRRAPALRCARSSAATESALRPPLELEAARAPARARRPPAANGRVRLHLLRLGPRDRAPARGRGRAVVLILLGLAGGDADPVHGRLVQGEAAHERVREPAPRPADHARGLAQGGPQLQAGDPERGRGGHGAGRRRSSSACSPRRSSAGPMDDALAETADAGRLEELLLRDHRGHDPEPGRRLAREPVRHDRGHRPAAAAVRPQDQGR